MAEISAKDVAALRKMTGAGMMDCKRALLENDGDMERAKDWLREKGIAGAAKRSGRAADQGAVEVLVTPDVAAVVELNCETDFVAKTDLFQQVAAMRPQYVNRDDVPPDVVANERRIAEQVTREEGKPEQAWPKIVEGKLNGFFKTVALVEQSFVKDQKQTIGALVQSLGADAAVRRFARVKIGED